MMEQILRARDHYQVLGLERDCNEMDIKKSHRNLVRLVHPDKVHCSSDSEMKRTERAFRAVQVAYETLSLPHKRKAYDLQLKMQGKSAQFVPGESSNSGEDLDAEDGPTTVQFFTMILQILLAVTIHVAKTALAELLMFHTAQALPLQIAMLAHIFLWAGFGCGFLTSAIWVGLGYTLNNLVGTKKLFIWILRLGILQFENWNTKGGIPFWAFVFVTIHLQIAYQTSFSSAFISGVMAGLTILIGLLMPNMSFGSNAIYVGGVIAFVGVYYCSVDVFGAIFVGILAWHFLQGLPTVCLGTLGMVLLYIVYRLSISVLLFVFALVILFLGSEQSLLLVVIVLLSAIISISNYGFWSFFLYFLAVYGGRRMIKGKRLGKRMILSVGLIWCLECGFLSGMLCAFISYIAGEILVATRDVEHDDGEYRPRKDGSAGDDGKSKSTPNAKKNNKKGRK